MAKAVAKRIAEDIDEYCVRTYDGGHRWHLGASLIGHECSRYLWYIFRWCFRNTGPTLKDYARRQRLFNRGHREEDRFIEFLKGIGCEVWTHDTTQPPDENGEYPQYRISGVMGHFGGSLDGIARLPARYRVAEPVLTEFKTNGTGKGFANLLTQGMVVTKPQHYAQTSTYGSVYTFNYCLYLNINKNDDDLHVELVKLDHNLGFQMRAKAEKIILSPTPPERLSNNPTYFKCSYCDAKAVCHGEVPPEKNCRSCVMAQPVDGGEWYCGQYQNIIPRNFVPNGCENYKAVV